MTPPLIGLATPKRTGPDVTEAQLREHLADLRPEAMPLDVWAQLVSHSIAANALDDASELTVATARLWASSMLSELLADTGRLVCDLTDDTAAPCRLCAVVALTAFRR